MMWDHLFNHRMVINSQEFILDAKLVLIEVAVQAWMWLTTVFLLKSKCTNITYLLKFKANRGLLKSGS